MRQGRVFKRCSRCGEEIEPKAKACRRRGHNRWSWAFVVDVAPVGAPRDQLRRGGFATKGEALAAMAEVQMSVSRGTYVQASSAALGSFLVDEWLPAAKATLRPVSWHQAERLLRTHVVARPVGRVPLQLLQPSHLNALYAELLTSGRLDGKGGLSPQTVTLIHARLRRALADAVRWGRVQRNVASLADPPRVPKPKLSTWTAAELRAFLAVVADERDYTLWHLYATTGARRGEALALGWPNVDLDAGRLHITASVTTMGAQTVTGEPKSGASRRTIAVDPRTVGVLRDHRKRQLAERLRWGPAWQETGLVFAREDGSAMHPNAVSKRFAALVKATGLPRIRLHDVRHSYATAALAAGVPVKVVSQRLGHADITTTLRTYAHVMPGDDEAAAAVAATAILG